MAGCIPAEKGYYFASRKTEPRGYKFREVVRIGKDGFGHMRAFVTRSSRGYNPCEFENYSEPLMDPGKKRKT